MNIQLIRYNSTATHTNGLLFVNGVFQCYTLEDEYREKKIHSETRIPDGKYKLGLREVGGFDSRYRKLFGTEFHKGMVWIKDVPNFEYILLHIGNTDKDTAGCILVGDSNSGGTNFIGNSTNAYKKVYPIIRDVILKCNMMFIDASIEIETIG